MSSNDRREIRMEKQIHRFGHSSADYMSQMMRPTGYDEEKIETACKKVQQSCPVFAASGRPTNRKNYSPHISIPPLMNNCRQTSYAQQYIKKIFEILNIMDLGARYGELIIERTDRLTTRKQLLKLNSIIGMVLHRDLVLTTNVFVLH